MEPYSLHLEPILTLFSENYVKYSMFFDLSMKEMYVFYITAGMLYYNVYPLKFNKILPNKKLGQKSLKIAVLGDFTKNFKEISNYFHKNPFRFILNSKFRFFR